MTLISDFIAKVQNVHKTGIAREHAYRPALHDLLSGLSTEITPVNDPAKSDIGAPDFIILRGDIAIGHLEAKDVGISLRNMKDANKKQQDRYKAGFPNLVYTNCLDWDFYRNGTLIASVCIGELDVTITTHPDQYVGLENLLKEFIAQRPQSITSPKVLAQRMAGKAQLIKDVLFNTLMADKKKETELAAQYNAFKEHLIHDITLSDFSDIYAETIAYGMFAARLHDTTLNDFSRQEALTLLPKSNPFLRNLFSFIAGIDLDERIAWIIDDLAAVFQASDVAKIMEGFGKLTGRKDPFLHFYETFLAAYNPKKRKARGVWYTPEAVVNFIVRAVDEVLKTEFKLADGLADTSKTAIEWDTGQRKLTKKGTFTKDGQNSTEVRQVHRVQILDPATGTGTFLAEIIKQIAPKIQGVAPGMWSPYIEKDLIPRLHGFELLMASYAMCHMKLDMILTDLGYKPTGTPPRLSVYLTNSLEEGEPANQTLPFAQWLSSEVKQANAIKRDMPIMCVLGNPPYLGEGGKSEGWLGRLMNDYKKEPGGIEKLKEKNSKWINDLYVKFIRLSSHLIEKNGSGVLGFITNHGYLDNPTFRGMRWHLLKSFDKIWILDLHGNSKKKELSPDETPDKNVFDIQQGVSIIIACKSSNANVALGKVMHGELWGDRESKYNTLFESSIKSNIFSELDYKAPQYAFSRLDLSASEDYEKGPLLNELMPLHGNGIVTKRDELNIQATPAGVVQVVHDFQNLPEADVRMKYHLPADVRDWKYAWAKKDVSDHAANIPIQEIGYRLFDNRYIFYSGRARGLVGWPVTNVMQNYIRGENIGLLTSKAHKDARFAHAFVTDKPTEAIFYSATTGSNAMNFPLYIYPDEQALDKGRRINFNNEHLSRFKHLGEDSAHGTPDEVAVFDYIYGVLHSSEYRKTYAVFFKSGFPRIPWPSSADAFWTTSAKGTRLRKLHLLEAEAIGSTPFPFTGDGAGRVGQTRYDDGKIWINDNQYFDAVPEEAWNLVIGGYQPAYKWLKDRRGMDLGFEDIKHYQKVIKVLSETAKILAEPENAVSTPS